MPAVGVLALQGDFEAHCAALRRVGVDSSEVRRTSGLDGLDGLVLPGGESTTLLNLMADEPWFDALQAFHARGGAILGTCAGAILLSREVRSPAQTSLGLIDVVIERNGFGRQVDSFEAQLQVRGLEEPLRAAFIRAPRFRSVSNRVEVLATLDGEPVLVRQGSTLAATFHPELTGDDRLHRMLVNMAARPGLRAACGT